jgi:ABC-type multidrug transport system fused ATPase/permease subunit
MKKWLNRLNVAAQTNSLRDLTLTPSLHRAAEADELQRLLQQEQEIIAQRKHAAGSAEKAVVGLALSGGGIRSATFCFGILQVLERKHIMKHVDFLSTVSGGGYTGAAYSAWRLRQSLAHKTAQTPADDAITVSKKPPASWEELLPHLRKFSNYLAPSLGMGSSGTWRIVATMVRNLAIHWQALIAAIVLAFAALLLSLRYLWSVSVLCSFVGLLLIAGGWVQERAGKAYVRDCQDGSGEAGFGARLRRWLAGRFDNADERGAADSAQERCDTLARKVRNLLQSPRLPLFTGLIFYAIGAALGFVFSTYPQYPLINLTLPAWLHADALSSLLPSYLVPDFRLGTRFWAAVLLVAVSAVLVSIVGFASEWRWRPRRDFFPKPSWIGFVLIALMIPVTWFGLAHYNGGLSSSIVAEPIDLVDIFPRTVTWSLAVAWSYAWQTGVVLLLFALLTSVTIAVFNDQMDREEREWSTRIVSVCLATAVAWTGLAALTLGSAKLAQDVYSGSLSGHYQLGGAGLTGVWLLLSTWIARLGKTEVAQSLTRTYWKRVAITLGPWFFLAGLIILTCVGAVLLLLMLSSKFAPIDTLPVAHVANAVLWSGWYVTVLLVLAAVIFLIAGVILDPNEYSLHGFYRDRLVRCYLGASNADTPAPDSIWNIRTDDLPFADTLTAVKAERCGAPFHIVNTAVNLFGSKDLRVQQRHCDSFMFTPLGCGSWATNYAATPPRLYLGTALAISGAAVSSNAGLATYGAAIAALMTFFNMRLGFWFGNPRFASLQSSKRPPFAPKYLFAEGFSATNEDLPFVNLSDGGHFDNLGLYELIRRRCRYIIVVDAECDPAYSFSSLAQVIRMARIDFDVSIEINVEPIAPKPGESRARGHWTMGTIRYKDTDKDVNAPFPDRGLRQDGETEGKLLYIKNSFLADEKNGHISADVIEYAKRHSRFPHDTTADQFFNEQQFESYRKLAECIATQLLTNAPPISDIKSLFEHLQPHGGVG